MKIRQQLQCELARREFWEYCKLTNPSFYKEDRLFLQNLCNELQEFYYNDVEFMIVNKPPRHGKSFTGSNFVQWMLGQNPLEKIMTGSYNEDLSKLFSKGVRDVIGTEKLGDNIVYGDIFPNTKIKFGSSEAKRWQTDVSKQINYLATSPTGSATGMGATMLVIDDLVKNGEEANNATVLEKHYNWFTNTMLSRREGKRKVLIIMTRWNSNDLAGKILKYVKDNNISYQHINYQAYNEETGKMLCDEIMNYEAYLKAKDLMGQDIFSANYQQIPLDLKGVLYSYFMEYDELPPLKMIENYTDTADTGSDSLVSINYGISMDNKAYILDILCTKEGMELTEGQVAEMLTKDNVNYAHIESNNGGRGFSRNVQRLAQLQGNRRTIFKPFHQSANKISRILTGSTGVMQNIYYPKGWKQKYKAYYDEISTHQREGKNLHDDCADCITGVYEMVERKIRGRKSSGLKL